MEARETPLPAMCAEGMFCQQLLGRPPTDPRMQETAAYLQTRLPSTEKEKINYYYWYYGCLALYQHQGPVWEQWNEQIRKIFLHSQNGQGDDSGSWDPAGQWGRESGRVVATALATLSLEVYYRYLPLYGLTGATAAAPVGAPIGRAPVAMKPITQREHEFMPARLAKAGKSR